MCDITLHGYVGGLSILILRPPATPATLSLLSSTVQLVFVGFGHSVPAEESREAGYTEEYGEETVDEWLRSESSSLIDKLCHSFGTEEIQEWIVMEEERGLLEEEFPYFY